MHLFDFGRDALHRGLYNTRTNCVHLYVRYDNHLCAFYRLHAHGAYNYIAHACIHHTAASVPAANSQYQPQQ